MSLLLTKVYGFIDWFVKGGAFVGPVVSVIPAVASPHQLSSGGSPVFYWGGGVGVVLVAHGNSISFVVLLFLLSFGFFLSCMRFFEGVAPGRWPRGQ